MNKKTFLTKLEAGLSILDDREVDLILDKYSNMIDGKIKDGVTEKEAVAMMGSVDDVIAKVLKEHKVKKDYQNENRLENWLDDFIENMVRFFQNFYNSITEQKASRLIINIFYIIILLLMLWLFLWFIKVPFEILEAIGLGIINVGQDDVIADTIGHIWSFIIDITYLVVAVIVVMAMYKKIANYFDQNPRPFKKEDVKPLAKEVEKEVRNISNDDTLSDFLTIFAKLFVAIFVYLPLLMMDCGLVAAIGITIFFMTQGITTIGLLLIIIGKLLIMLTLTVLITNYLINKNITAVRKYMMVIVVGFLVIISGITTFVFEVLEYDYVNSLPSTVETVEATHVYNIQNDILFLVDDKETTINVIADEAIKQGEAKVKVSYYSEVKDLKISQSSVSGGKKISYYTIDSPDSYKYYYDFTIDSLKDKKVYNYELFETVGIKVYVNPLDINRVVDYGNDDNSFYIKDETVVCASMMEPIAEDQNYTYYLSCLKSSTVYLIYANGDKISVRAALDSGQVTIYELLAAGLEVYKEPKN